MNLSLGVAAGETLRLRVCNDLPTTMEKTNGEVTDYSTHTQPMIVSSDRVHYGHLHIW